MKKTLLLCFIHGFKGGDDTFGAEGEFTEHLAALLSAELPRVAIRTLVYPKYETRGDLRECVARFRDWLLEKVIDLEVAQGTPSPTVDPGVRTILIGHSMGGIVAAETALALSTDRPIVPHEEAREGGGDQGHDDGADAGGGGGGGEPGAGEKAKARTTPEPSSFNAMMFPYVQGVLAFDTPYLGISPGVVAHGAEGHYQNAAAVLGQLSSLTGLWGGNKTAQEDAARQAAQAAQQKPLAALEAPPNRGSKKDGKGAAAAASGGGGGGGGWGGWGKIAMAAGAAGALAAGGAAAYVNRQQLTEGWSWVGSHLEFVGCLAKGEELRSRVQAMVRLEKEVGVGFANLYTRLGQAAGSKQVSTVGLVMGNQRTFCNLPKKQAAGVWKEAVNDAAKDETGAHMTMFEAKHNPGFAKLSDDAKNLIVGWTKNEWYETSSLEIEE